MKHALRHQQSRRFDRETGRWRSAAGSTVMLEAMLKALARQQANMATPPPASSPQSRDHHDHGQPRQCRRKRNR
jgi:hypothetical protein